VDIADIGPAGELIMPETTPITYTDPLPGIPSHRAPTSAERGAWNRLLVNHDNALRALDRAGLLLRNVYTTFQFGGENGIVLTPIDPTFESDYYAGRKNMSELTRMIRDVEDGKLGIRLASGDIDIMTLPAQQFSGWIIPAVGVGLIALVIGAGAYAYNESKRAAMIAVVFAKLLHDTDRMFCSKPGSATCQKWKAVKAEKKYEQNMTLADSLKAGAKTVLTGLGLGILALIGLPILLRRI
jgi:hypothetical protein